MGAVCKVRGIYRYFCDVGCVLDIFAKRVEVLDVLHQGGECVQGAQFSVFGEVGEIVDVFAMWR